MSGTVRKFVKLYAATVSPGIISWTGAVIIDDFLEGGRIVRKERPA